MLYNSLFILCCVLLFPFNGSSQDNGKEIVIGHSFSLHSDILHEERPYLIYLPEDYTNDGQPISVMYLLDGTGHFHHTTGIVNFLKYQGSIPNMMVVGIPNTNDRTRDLTPKIEKDTKAAEERPNAGGADNMLAFLKDELIPHIDKTYNTSSYRILNGHSFGGLFAVHTLLSEPQLFDAYISISPSMWWDQQNLVSRAESFLDTEPELNSYFYMTMGNEDDDMLGGAMKLAALFEEANDKCGLDWDFRVMKEETHGSIPHRSTYYGLEAIFKNWYALDYKDIMSSKGVDGILSHYEMVSEKLGYQILPSEGDMNNLGYDLMGNKNYDAALEVFLMNVEKFPNSSNVYDSAAEAYMMKEENDKSIKLYKKSLQLNPGNSNAIEMMKEMGYAYNPEELKVELSKKEQKAFVGGYAVNVGGVLSIKIEEGSLVATHPAMPKQTLICYSNNVFLLMPDKIPLKFEMDTDKNVLGFEAEMGIGATVAGKKIE